MIGMAKKRRPTVESAFECIGLHHKRHKSTQRIAKVYRYGRMNAKKVGGCFRKKEFIDFVNLHGLVDRKNGITDG